MRKISVIFFTFAASLLLFTGSSPWEGAAAVAPAGELPATGHFIATNSFPRNSVVDITNLETGKSTRAIVAGSLESQGLLAVVSRDAAELMGMREGSISRIRMVQPSDTIANWRFSEGMAADTPAYDSGNVLTEEMYRNDPYRPPVAQPVERAPVERQPEPMPTPRNTTGPSYVLEPEWRTRETIVDVERYTGTERRVTVVQPPVEERVEEETVEEIAEEPENFYYAEEEPKEKFENVYDYVYDHIAEEEAEEKIEEEPVSAYEYVYDHIVEEEIEKEPEYFYEYLVEEEIKEEPVSVAEQPVKEEIVTERVEYFFVPAEERPPEGTIYGIDPSVIIPELAKEDETFMPERSFVETIPERTVSPVPTASPVPVTPASVPESRSFTAPSISEISSGQYYVQLAAVRSPDDVDSLLNQINRDVRTSNFRIDRDYSPVVYKGSDVWYRILYGPFLNQGESAAVQQRFVSIGYRDAFVTQR